MRSASLPTSGYEPEVEQRQAQIMVSRGIDGLILRGDVHSEGLRRLLQTQRIPFVNVGVHHPDKPYASVGADNEAGAYLVRTLAGLPAPLHHEVEASLVVRESTAPPPG